MPKWVYPLSFLFLLFVIYNDPGGAGSMAHAFAEFVGNIISTFGEFLSGLFGDSGGGGRTTTNPDAYVPPDVRISPDVTAPAAPTTDVYGHGHTHGYGG